jgi:hypothetical protein
MPIFLLCHPRWVASVLMVEDGCYSSTLYSRASGQQKEEGEESRGSVSVMTAV